MNPVRNSKIKKHLSENFRLFKNQFEISNGVNQKGFTLIEHERSKNGGRNKGFTLIELLVATAVIVIISSIFLADYRTGQKQFALERSAHKLAQDLRRTEELSMSAKSYDCPAGYKMRGYGINFETGDDEDDYYLLKARCEDEEHPGDPLFYNDQTIEKIDLEKKVKISELTTNPLDVFFYPPAPEIDLGGTNIAEITLSIETEPVRTQSVIVNKAGLINVTD